MERPYGGRTTWQDTVNGAEILIPSKKNYFVIFFLIFWGSGWLMGEVSAIVIMIGKDFDDIYGRLFLLVWLIPWTAAGFFVIRIAWWMLAGKEVLAFERGLLTVTKKGALFVKAKTFDLQEVKSIRVADTSDDFPGLAMQKGMWISAVGNRGSIKFDYGLKTVRVGENVDEAEAKFIINSLKAKGILAENNY